MTDTHVRLVKAVFKKCQSLNVFEVFFTFCREDLHKVDAIEFAHQRAAACTGADELQDKRSAALLWNLLILLCRQNGVRMQLLNITFIRFSF